MKSMSRFLTVIAISTLFSASVFAGTATTQGWYYTTIWYSGGSPQFGQVGAFSTLEDCQSARWDDYGDGGAVPWDGGGGCIYVYENDLDAYNELIDARNLNINNGNGMPSGEMDIQELLAEINVIMQEHNIKDYKKKLSKLTPTKRR